MKFIEKIGNIKVYMEQNARNDITIIFMNGSDIIKSETYFTDKPQRAIDDLFRKMDIYTEEWLYIYAVTDLVKLSDNTYKISEKDWFCRIDNTKYFRHFHKMENDFVIDKNGKRIIDR